MSFIAPLPPNRSVGSKDPAGDTNKLTEAIQELRQGIPGTIAQPRVHVILAMGQSNMSGRGTPYSPVTDPTNPRIYQYGAKSPGLVLASEPLDMHDAPTGIGPALQFARHYLQTLPLQDRIVIIPTAEGGTKLSTNLTNGWRWGVPGNLTAQALAQLDAALLALAGAGWGVVSVDAVLWLQGETDGTDGTTGAQYRADLELLISGLRGLYGADLPFIMGAIVPETLGPGTRAQINAVHSNTPFRVGFTGWAKSDTGYMGPDGLHYTGAGQRMVGARMFAEFQRARAGLAPVNAPVPYVAVSDDFNRADGALTTTPVGAKAWVQSRPAGVVSNQAKFTTAPGGVGTCVFDAGQADGTLTITVLTVGADPHAGILFRYADANNYLLLVRVSQADPVWRLTRRVAGVTSNVYVTTVTMADGQVIKVDLNGSLVTVAINGATVYTGDVPYLTTATMYGFYAGSGNGPAFDNVSFMSLV